MLLAAGHPAAWNYPIGLVIDEARLVAERFNQQEATRVTLLQMAVSTLFSEDAGKDFKTTVLKLLKG